MSNKKGFTLVEIILYVAISSTVVLGLTSFFQVSLAARNKSKAMTEVNQQGLHIMQVVNQNIANADSINLPTSGKSASSLSLNFSDPTLNPTVFNLSGYNFNISQGLYGSALLNSSKVLVSDLIFENLSKTDTPGIIRLEFTLTYDNPFNLQEFNWSKTFYTSVSLR